jgi:hypothetical protein
MGWRKQFQSLDDDIDPAEVAEFEALQVHINSFMKNWTLEDFSAVRKIEVKTDDILKESAERFSKNLNKQINEIILKCLKEEKEKSHDR